MPLTPTDSDSDSRSKRALSFKSTHHFVSDPFLNVPLYGNRMGSSPLGETMQRSNERQVSLIRARSDATSKIVSPGSDAAHYKSRSNSPGTAFANWGAKGATRSAPKPASDKISSLGEPTTREAAYTTKGSEEPFGKQPLTNLSSIDKDEAISITSEESEGNVSIPHGELADGNQGDTDHPESVEDTNVPASFAMPTESQARLDEWYAVHGRVVPPCATSTPPSYLNSRNVAGEPSYFVDKSGECLEVCMYLLSDVRLPRHSQSKQRVIVAQGPTQGPFFIKFASQKNGHMVGSGYKIWHGVRGGDKDGFELKPSVFKKYKSSGTTPAVSTPDAKKVVVKEKAGLKGNQFYAANGTPKSGTTATGNSPTSKASYDFRPTKRLKQGEESPGSYSKLLAAFSSSAEPFSSHRQGEPTPRDGLPKNSRIVNSNQVAEHIQNNAVFLFSSKKSPQPRARLFSACNTVQKLFAQALAGDVFDEESAAAKVLSVRVAGQCKAKAVVEDDEQDFDDVVEELKAASCWITAANGEISGSCTVEVRSRS